MDNIFKMEFFKNMFNFFFLLKIVDKVQHKNKKIDITIMYIVIS
ncbi:hypothetical protein QO7_2239 [Clostridioides difficile F314]|nr:hypothetical protein QK3_2235 [Clostridioides difficile DA00145]EQH99745.1 hypothetical protein QO7_2239 [Clostridioides difficile F314]